MSKTREKTEQRLVSATIKVLDAEGYKDVSVKKITKEENIKLLILDNLDV